ncbi:MAG: type II secretion system secretin GspD [Cellvibrionaceae bacterium]|nr:type II secretion system secretin GspD [Cellvibrionaceae bacterium]
MLRRITSLGAAGALALTLAVNSWAQQTWMINFKDSDIQELIKFVADVTGRTVIIDPRVKGRIKVISSKPMNEAELLQMFRTTLEMHDFSMVEVEGVLRIIPLKDARSSPVPVVGGNSTEKGYLTQVIQLQNIAAAKILPSIRPLVPQHSHLSAYDPSNAIIITDSAENIARIRELIERLDKSATPITEIVELKYANAADLVQVLQGLEKADPNNNNLPNNSLNLTSDKRNNAVLITGEDVQRQRMKSLITRLDKPRAQTGNVRVVYLDYAEAKSVAETLTKVMANLSKLGPGGKQENVVAATVEADEDTNALLITASGDDLDSLLDVVARLDIRRAQVLVEAVIAEVGESARKNLGIEWLFLDSSKGVFGSSARAGSRLGTVGAGALGLEGAENSTEAIGKLAGALVGDPGQLFGVVGQNNDNSFLALVNALEDEGQTNILSTPSLLTMDNQEASFVVGKNIPILTGSTSTTTNGGFSPFQTIQRQDVGIKLTVTPQVNEGSTILLTVAQEVSSIDTSSPADQGFVTNQRKIETKVMASNGEVVVLGGLIEDQLSKGELRVPVLGRIPVLGRLFRSENRNKVRTNLMVFLKVTVIRDVESLAGATAEKYKYLRDQQLKQREGGFMRRKDSGVSVLPEFSSYSLPGQPAGAENGVIVTPAAKAAQDEATEEPANIPAPLIEQ